MKDETLLFPFWTVPFLGSYIYSLLTFLFTPILVFLDTSLFSIYAFLSNLFFGFSFYLFVSVVVVFFFFSWSSILTFFYSKHIYDVYYVLGNVLISISKITYVILNSLLGRNYFHSYFRDQKVEEKGVLWVAKSHSSNIWWSQIWIQQFVLSVCDLYFTMPFTCIF